MTQFMSETISDRKRKRTKNTTNEQYQIYLHALENDFTLRSNTINPTMPPNCLSEKWEALSEKLNSIGTGPTMSPDEWKKRFTDWKYSTKAKYRKIQTHRGGTGGGPMSELKLTELENRALDVWGRVTVEGTQNVTPYEGVPSQRERQEEVLNLDEIMAEIGVPVTNENNEQENVFVIPTSELQSPISQHQETNRRIRQKPLSLIAQNLLSVSEERVSNQNQIVTVVDNFAKKYIELETEKLELEKKKFEFEVSKFKFLHPNFNC